MTQLFGLRRFRNSQRTLQILQRLPRIRGVGSHGERLKNIPDRAAQQFPCGFALPGDLLPELRLLFGQAGPFFYQAFRRFVPGLDLGEHLTPAGLLALCF